MSANNELLREGIIGKLKEYEAYIDNELPDYIMVMLANSKTVDQINNDLQLFLGDNTNRFTDWLQRAIAAPETILKAPSPSHSPERGGEQEMEEEEEETERASPSHKTTTAGVKRKRKEEPDHHHHHRSSSEREAEEKPSPQKIMKISYEEHGSEESGRIQRVKLELEESQRSRGTARKIIRVKPEPSKDQDLRELIARRREGRREREEGRKDGGSGEEEEEGEEEEGGGGRGNMPSVVRLVERPRQSNVGGSRLLQRAIQGLGGVGSSRRPQAKHPSSSSTRRVGRQRVTVQHPAASEASHSPPTLPPHPSTNHSPPETEPDEVEESFVDEFREEQQEEEERREKATITAIRKHVGTSSDEPQKEDEEERRREKATLMAIRKVLPEKKSATDLRELLNKSKEEKKSETSSSSSSSTRFVVTLDGLGDKYQYVDPSEDLEQQPEGGGKEEEEEEEEEEGEEVEASSSSGKGGGMPERCRFWPNCKNGDSCPFHHPSAPCKLFPNCKYGNKCCFVHPQCKFDARCTRADCPYLHTAPRHLMFKQPRTPVAQPPVVFRPPFRPSHSYSPHRSWGQSGSSWQRPSRFPNKSALTWTPNKPQHLSQREFALPEDQTTSLPV